MFACLQYLTTCFLCSLSLFSCVKYVPEPEDSALLKMALKIYKQFHRYPQALRLALMLNDMSLVKEVFMECPDR